MHRRFSQVPYITALTLTKATGVGVMAPGPARIPPRVWLPTGRFFV